MNATTKTTFAAALEIVADNYDGEKHDMPTTLAVDSGKGFDYRFAVTFIDREHEGRQEHGGPMVPGPWAFANQQCSVIAANPEHGTYGQVKRAKAAGRYIPVETGTLIKVDDAIYRITVERSFGVCDLVLDLVHDLKGGE
jgi:hypothetical protein